MTTQRIRRTAAALTLGGLVVGAPLAAGAAEPSGEPATTPQLQVRIQQAMADLDHPWDVAFTPDGTMLVTERDRERISAKLPNGNVRVLADNPEGIWHGGETGLMGIVVSPDFATNNTFYTCSGSDAGRKIDIRVIKWEVNAAFTEATQIAPIVTGLPVSTGRHGGCRLRFSPNGALYIGTGDAATGTNPQDLTSLGGKVLRVNADTGRPFRGNPFKDASNKSTRLIWTYGHRNVQGLAYRTGTDPAGMWSVEQGTDRDDEVNQLVEGGNAGYNPVPGYNESVPMTDFSLGDDVFGARWSSGFPTLATSGATWVTNAKWGVWQGRLAVAALKDESVSLMRFGPFGGLIDVMKIEDLDSNFGRLRTIQTGPRGDLYVTTDNGAGDDVVLKVTPRV